jgi:hypothetical protein
MAELKTPPERSEIDVNQGPDPLWLPRGSVRAVIALGVIGVWALLETGAVGVAASDAVRSIAVAIAGGYGLLRAREQKMGGSE